MIKIEHLTKETVAEWNDFVESYVQKEYGFTLKWRNVLAEVFGYKSFYYCIRNDDCLIGLFPVYLINSRLLGDRLVSVPFTDMGGFYFIPSLDEEIKKEAFHKTLDKLNDDLRIKSARPVSFELRGPLDTSSNFLLQGGFVKIIPYVKFIVRLDSPWKQIEGGFSRNITRNLKKSHGKLKIDICQSKAELIDIYDIYLDEMKRLGSPPLPYLYFEQLWDEFYPTGNFLIFTAYERDKIAGAISLLTFKKVIYADLIMGRAGSNYLYLKTQLYFESLHYAWESKIYDIYDFNRTRRDSGVFLHKSRWGGAIEDIPYYINTGDGRPEEHFFDVSRREVRIMNKMLKRCPKGLLRLSGKPLRKQLAK